MSDERLIGLLRLLRRRMWLILSITTAVMVLAIVASTMISPRYTAAAKLVVDRGLGQSLMGTAASSMPPDSEAMATQVRMLSSRGLAYAVVSELDLVQDPLFNKRLGDPSILTQGRAWAAAYAPEWLASKLASEDTRPSDALVVETYLKALRVTIDGRSRAIDVAFTWFTPERAAEIANAHARLYLDRVLNDRLNAVETASGRLQERVTATKLELASAEERAQAFRRNAELVADGGTTLASQQLAELSSQLVLARADAIRSQSRLDDVRQLNAAGRIETLAEVQNSPIIAHLRDQELGAARRVAELSGSLGNRHPDLIDARASLSTIRQNVDTEVGRIVSAVQGDVSVTSARVSAIEQSMGDLKQLVAEQSDAEVQARTLDREAQSLRETLEALQARVKDATQIEGLGINDAEMLAQAYPPLDPSFPKRWLIMLVALAAGTGLGVAVSLAIEAYYGGIRSLEEVERDLDATALALVPTGRKPLQSIVWRPNSAFAESMRSLGIELNVERIAGQGIVLIVTSPSPGEGKTTLASGLARSLAVEGKRVLLIDGDMRRPRVHTALGLREGAGLSDVLRGKTDLADAVVVDAATQLDVLTSGRSKESPIALLRSDRLVGLMAEARMHYDVVIVDTPPLLPVADARLLARVGDAVILTIRWGHTTRQAATLALRYLATVGTSLAGVVIGRVNTSYHRHYGYGDSAVYTPAAMRYHAD